MGKKIAALILSIMITSTIVACASGKKNETVNDNTNKTTLIEPELKGVWSTDYTRKEVQKLFDDILIKVEETAKEYQLNYEIKEEIKNENGKSVNDRYIYLDIEKPEVNRLESMYFGFRQYGSDLASGNLSMMLSSNLNKDEVVKSGNFNFAETSFAAFSEDFTGNSKRDYTELSKKIYDMISGKSEVETIENNLDGIKETISITDNFLLYKLETKEYNFKEQKQQ